MSSDRIRLSSYGVKCIPSPNLRVPEATNDVGLSAFTDATNDWFDGITLTNTRAYFTANRHNYLSAVREPFEALLAELAREFDGTPYVFRPNRDVRFSPDKRPYKTNVSGYLAGRDGTAVDVYAELSSDGFFAATGYHEMKSDQLDRFRKALTGKGSTEIGARLRVAIEAVLAAGYDLAGEQLKTVPKGIDRKSENIDLLRYKALFITARYPLIAPQDPAPILNFIRTTWRAGDTINEWLETHVGPSSPSLNDPSG